MKTIHIIALPLLSAFAKNAQTNISGTIFAENDEPLKGATAILERPGTTTNANGS